MKDGDLENVSGVLFLIAAFMAFMSISVFPAFLQDRSVFMKERVNNSFSVLSYNVGSVLAGIPFIALFTLASTLFCYPCLQLNGDDARYRSHHEPFATLLCAESIVYFVAATTPLLTVDIPDGWRWVHHIGFLSYFFRSFMVNELRDRTVGEDLDTELFGFTGFEAHSEPRDLGMLSVGTTCGIWI